MGTTTGSDQRTTMGSAVADVIDVDLCWTEVRVAAMVGVERNTRAMWQGSTHAYGAKGHDKGWQFNIVGTIGEYAVAKALGLYAPFSDSRADLYAGDLIFPAFDGPRGIQVRATTLDRGALLVHPRDPDDQPFVLVTGQPPRLTVRGWLFGFEAKDPVHWREAGMRHPAFAVPQDVLRPIETLASHMGPS